MKKYIFSLERKLEGFIAKNNVNSSELSVHRKFIKKIIRELIEEIVSVDNSQDKFYDEFIELTEQVKILKIENLAMRDAYYSATKEIDLEYLRSKSSKCYG